MLLGGLNKIVCVQYWVCSGDSVIMMVLEETSSESDLSKVTQIRVVSLEWKHRFSKCARMSIHPHSDAAPAHYHHIQHMEMTLGVTSKGPFFS